MAIDFRWLGIKRNIQPITGKNLTKSLALAAIAESERTEAVVVAPVAIAA